MGDVAQRGRPKGQITPRRQQMLDVLARYYGEPVTFAALARDCGLWSYNDARRILADLKRMGHL